MPPNAKSALTKPRLKVRFQNLVAARHMSSHTARAYWHWIVTFIRYHRITDEDTLCADREQRMADFLTAEANRGVSASTQNQAFNSLLFLYNDVLVCPVGALPSVPRPKRPERLPELVTDRDAKAVLSQLTGDMQLLCSLLYGCGLRLHDALRLRCKDVDLDRGLLTIREGKGDKDRIVPIPASLTDALAAAVERREDLHKRDLAAGLGWVWMPHLLAAKYPKEAKSWRWQYVFAAPRPSKDPQTGNTGRHHISAQLVQMAVREAAKKAKVRKKVTPHVFRHSYVAAMEDKGVPVPMIAKLLGHKSVETTMRYSQFSKRGVPAVGSPLD